MLHRKQFRQFESSKVIKNGIIRQYHIRLPIRLPKQLYAYVMSFRRSGVTKEIMWIPLVKNAVQNDVKIYSGALAVTLH